jgi:tetratricopeptide (TPR) repeat protein
VNEHHEKEAKVLETLASLTRQQVHAVEHVLECTECTGHLIDELAEGEVPLAVAKPAAGEPEVESSLLQRLEARTPGLLRALQGRAAEARELFAELQRADPARRPAMIRTKRFRSVPLAGLLLIESERAQPWMTDRSEELARLALTLTDQITEPQQASGLAELRSRAYVLLANARRLDGQLSKADELFGEAAFSLTRSPGSSARAFHCQMLALLRLDTGRPDEATGLLWRAADTYGTCGDLPEEGFCLAQLGFLYLEDSRPDRAEPVLRRACMAVDRSTLPGLWVRARMALALCHASLGRPQRAARLAERTRPHFDSARTQEMEAVTWLDGQVAALTGQQARAKELLGTVRPDVLTAGRLHDTLLASRDLALLATERRDPETLGDLLSEVVPRLPCDPRQLAVLAALGRFAAAAEKGGPADGLWQTVAWTLALLHRLRRGPGHRLVRSTPEEV